MQGFISSASTFPHQSTPTQESLCVWQYQRTTSANRVLACRKLTFSRFGVDCKLCSVCINDITPNGHPAKVLNLPLSRHSPPRHVSSGLRYQSTSTKHNIKLWSGFSRHRVGAQYCGYFQRPLTQSLSDGSVIVLPKLPHIAHSQLRLALQKQRGRFTAAGHRKITEEARKYTKPIHFQATTPSFYPSTTHSIAHPDLPPLLLPRALRRTKTENLPRKRRCPSYSAPALQVPGTSQPRQDTTRSQCLPNQPGKQ